MTSFLGNTGVGTTGWSRTEAEIFAERAVARGVPPTAILTETKATNTGENIRFTQALLREKGIGIVSARKIYAEHYALIPPQQRDGCFWFKSHIWSAGVMLPL